MISKNEKIKPSKIEEADNSFGAPLSSGGPIESDPNVDD